MTNVFLDHSEFDDGNHLHSQKYCSCRLLPSPYMIIDESQMKVTHWMQQKKTPRLHLIGFKQSIHTEVASVE